MSKKIVISTANELVSIAPEHIIYVSAEGNYSTLKLVDNSELTFSFNLQRFGDLLVDQLKAEATRFIRIGKSVIINRDYLFRVNPAKQQLILSGPMLQPRYTLSASKEALRQVKKYIESEYERV